MLVHGLKTVGFQPHLGHPALALTLLVDPVTGNVAYALGLQLTHLLVVDTILGMDDSAV